MVQVCYIKRFSQTYSSLCNVFGPFLRHGNDFADEIFLADSAFIKVFDGEAHFIVPPNEIPVSQRETLEPFLVQEPAGFRIQRNPKKRPKVNGGDMAIAEC